MNDGNRMKRIMLSIIIMIGIVSAGFLSTSFAVDRGISLKIKTPEGKTIDLYNGAYALVIGNGKYYNGWDPLTGAVDDSKEVARVLEKYGFDVTLKTDLTKEAFGQAFSEFSIKYGRNKDSQLLFYYAGHGYTEKMANGEDLGYIVMVDTPLPQKDPIGFNNKAVDMQTILTQAKIIQARHVLFMFDSCFSGSLLSMRDTVIPKSISDSVKYPVRQFITAGRAKEPVPDHSYFKQAFIDLLSGSVPEPIPDGYITGEELGLYLKNKVPEYNPTQHPQYGKINDPTLNKGDFVFAFNTDTIRSLGSASLKSSPEGAKIFLDNKLLEGKTTPFVIENLKPYKQYTLSVVKEGYEPWEKVFFPKAMETMFFTDITLERLFGKININTIPWTEVYIDGENIGMTPIAGTKLATRKYNIKYVNRSKNINYKESINIEANKTVNKVLRFEGTVNINTHPWAYVYANGRKLGTTPLAGLKLNVGKYDLLLSNPHADKEKKISITVNYNKVLNIQETLE